MVKELLAQGYVVYLMAALCFLGILGELIAGHIYRRLNKQAERIVYAKHPFFKRLRMEYEKASQIGAGVLDGDVFARKKIFTYRFCGIHLHSLKNASLIAGLGCVLAGSAAAYGCLWYGLPVKTLLLSAVGGVICALGLGLFHALANENGKAQFLQLQIRDYLMNAAGWRVQLGKEIKTVSSEGGTGKPGEEAGDFSGKAGRARAREIAELKKNLEQIAAAREKSAAAESAASADGKPEQPEEVQGLSLTREQEKLIQEILQEYFV